MNRSGVLIVDFGYRCPAVPAVLMAETLSVWAVGGWLMCLASSTAVGWRYIRFGLFWRPYGAAAVFVGAISFSSGTAALEGRVRRLRGQFAYVFN